jgi:beta-mannosidase
MISPLILFLQYAGDGRINPYANALEDAEIRYQVRRLSHHPSIAHWDSCNECGGGGVWDSFVATTVAEEDNSRPIWPSCPAAGWSTGVDMLTGLPNGNALSTRPTVSSLPSTSDPRFWTAPCGSKEGTTCTYVQDFDYDQGFIGKTPAAANASQCCDLCAADPTDCYAASFYEGTCYFKPSGKPFSTGNGVISVFPPGSTPPPLPPRTIETHGYYQHGGGFPAVNGAASLSAFDTLLPLSLVSTGPRGPGAYGVYASEFGASVYSSFESMAPTLAPEHWNIVGGSPPDSCTNGEWPSVCTGGNPMAQRNYPAPNFFLSFYGQDQVDKVNKSVGADIFKAQLYLATLSQALYIRSDIEGRRSDNQMGIVTWQLNEIWPTGEY